MSAEDWVVPLVIVVVVVGIIAGLWFFVIGPAIYAITYWWDIGNELWFLIGMFVGGIIVAIIAVYVATR